MQSHTLRRISQLYIRAESSYTAMTGTCWHQAQQRPAFPPLQRQLRLRNQIRQSNCQFGRFFSALPFAHSQRGVNASQPRLPAAAATARESARRVAGDAVPVTESEVNRDANGLPGACCSIMRNMPTWCVNLSAWCAHFMHTRMHVWIYKMVVGRPVCYSTEWLATRQ